MSEADYRSMHVKDIPDPPLPEVPKRPKKQKGPWRKRLLWGSSLGSAWLGVLLLVAWGQSSCQAYEKRRAAEMRETAIRWTAAWDPNAKVECEEMAGCDDGALTCTVIPPAGWAVPFAIRCTATSCLLR